MSGRSRHAVVAGLALAAAACDGTAPRAEVARGALVYGNDDRIEVFAYPREDAVRRAAAESLLALGFARELTAGGAAANRAGAGTESAGLRVASPTAEAKLNLCAGERFADQPSFAVCSGIAVTTHLVLTAAHCLEGGAPSELTALSGFYYASAGVLAALDASQAHAITEVVAENRWRDYALLRVSGADLVPVAIEGAAPLVGDQLSEAGHGMGVPAKIDGGGHVWAVDDDGRSFLTDLDAFGGASGAPVFAASGALLGVLTSGSRDYEQTPAGCYAAVAAPGGPGVANEVVMRAEPTVHEICAQHPDPELCAARLPAGGCAVAALAAPVPGGSAGLDPMASVAAAIVAARLVSACRSRGRSPAGAGQASCYCSKQ